MSFTGKDFSELLTIINANPEWRQQLVEMLFPDINLSQSMYELQQVLKELVEAQVRTEKPLNLLTKMVDEAAEDRLRIFDVVNQNITDLTGVSYEWTISYKASAIFGSLVRQGKNISEEISEQLYKALESDKISYNELERVIATDILWGGVAYPSGVDILLVIEISWRAKSNDIKRAVTRAGILKTLGIKAIPVVAGRLWDEKVIELALEHGVVVVKDKRINKDSWQSAIQPVIN